MSGPSDRLYLRSGRVAHLRMPPAIPGSTALSVACGRPGPWWGAGSQEEYEQAQSLPLCAHCVRYMKG